MDNCKVEDTQNLYGIINCNFLLTIIAEIKWVWFKESGCGQPNLKHLCTFLQNKISRLNPANHGACFTFMALSEALKGDFIMTTCDIHIHMYDMLCGMAYT